MSLLNILKEKSFKFRSLDNYSGVVNCISSKLAEIVLCRLECNQWLFATSKTYEKGGYMKHKLPITGSCFFFQHEIPFLKTFHRNFKSISYPKMRNLENKIKTSEEQSKKIAADSELKIRNVDMRDPIISDLLKNVRSRNVRDRHIILEGIRLIQEALRCSLKLQALLYSEEDSLKRLFNQINVPKNNYENKIFKISKHDLKILSVLKTPPGVLAVFRMPNKNEFKTQSPTLPITVICDNIREPNNLGSIIRSCAAIPCYQIIVMKGCCDPWETKCLRGSTGAHFHINIVDNVIWETVPQMIPSNDYSVYIAENNLQKVQSYEFKNKKSIITAAYTDIDQICVHNVVVIGGETHGISKEAYSFFDTSPNGKFLHVPLAKGIESLNVASAITLILYEFRKSNPV